MANYTKEQFWKLYEGLPKELQDAIFSEETANNIYDICDRNGVNDERVSEVARYTGRVLLGILLPEELQKTLEKEVKLTKDKADKIAREINRFVFYPVKESLASLHKTGPAPVSSSPAKPPAAQPLKGEEKKKIEKTDVYREPIE